MINIVIAGVGGQGTLLASKILGHIAVKNGYDVRVSEVHGMSQRGGSVITYVRISSDKKLYSSIVEQGQADVLLAFEGLEALRALPLLKPGVGVVISSTERIDPMPVITGAQEYPDDCFRQISRKAKLISLDAVGIAQSCGTARAANVVLLGVLSNMLPFNKADWLEALEANVKPQFLDMNKAAFIRGSQEGAIKD